MLNKYSKVDIALSLHDTKVLVEQNCRKQLLLVSTLSVRVNG